MTSRPVDDKADSGPQLKQTAATGGEGQTKADAEAKAVSAVWQDEKATAKAKHDRPDRQSTNEPLGDALNIGAGQVSSPYLTVTQADAIAKQRDRNSGK